MFWKSYENASGCMALFGDDNSRKWCDERLSDVEGEIYAYIACSESEKRNKGKMVMSVVSLFVMYFN